MYPLRQYSERLGAYIYIFSVAVALRSMVRAPPNGNAVHNTWPCNIHHCEDCLLNQLNVVVALQNSGNGWSQPRQGMGLVLSMWAMRPNILPWNKGYTLR
jgi:hypothetical protein